MSNFTRKIYSTLSLTTALLLSHENPQNSYFHLFTNVAASSASSSHCQSGLSNSDPDPQELEDARKVCLLIIEKMAALNENLKPQISKSMIEKTANAKGMNSFKNMLQKQLDKYILANLASTTSEAQSQSQDQSITKMDIDTTVTVDSSTKKSPQDTDNQYQPHSPISLKVFKYLKDPKDMDDNDYVAMKSELNNKDNPIPIELLGNRMYSFLYIYNINIIDLKEVKGSGSILQTNLNAIFDEKKKIKPKAAAILGTWEKVSRWIKVEELDGEIEANDLRRDLVKSAELPGVDSVSKLEELNREIDLFRNGELSELKGCLNTASNTVTSNQDDVAMEETSVLTESPAYILTPASLIKPKSYKEIFSPSFIHKFRQATYHEAFKSIEKVKTRLYPDNTDNLSPVYHMINALKLTPKIDADGNQDSTVITLPNIRANKISKNPGICGSKDCYTIELDSKGTQIRLEYWEFEGGIDPVNIAAHRIYKNDPNVKKLNQWVVVDIQQPIAQGRDFNKSRHHVDRNEERKNLSYQTMSAQDKYVSELIKKFKIRETAIIQTVCLKASGNDPELNVFDRELLETLFQNGTIKNNENRGIDWNYMLKFGPLGIKEKMTWKRMEELLLKPFGKLNINSSRHTADEKKRLEEMESEVKMEVVSMDRGGFNMREQRIGGVNGIGVRLPVDSLVVKDAASKKTKSQFDGAFADMITQRSLYERGIHGDILGNTHTSLTLDFSLRVGTVFSIVGKKSKEEFGVSNAEMINRVAHAASSSKAASSEMEVTTKAGSSDTEFMEVDDLQSDGSLAFDKSLWLAQIQAEKDSKKKRSPIAPNMNFYIRIPKSCLNLKEAKGLMSLARLSSDGSSNEQESNFEDSKEVLEFDITYDNALLAQDKFLSTFGSFGNLVLVRDYERKDILAGPRVKEDIDSEDDTDIEMEDQDLILGSSEETKPYTIEEFYDRVNEMMQKDHWINASNENLFGFQLYLLGLEKEPIAVSAEKIKHSTGSINTAFEKIAALLGHPNNINSHSERSVTSIRLSVTVAASASSNPDDNIENDQKKEFVTILKKAKDNLISVVKNQQLERYYAKKAKQEARSAEEAKQTQNKANPNSSNLTFREKQELNVNKDKQDYNIVYSRTDITDVEEIRSIMIAIRDLQKELLSNERYLRPGIIHNDDKTCVSKVSSESDDPMIGETDSEVLELEDFTFPIPFYDTAWFEGTKERSAVSHIDNNILSDRFIDQWIKKNPFWVDFNTGMINQNPGISNLNGQLAAARNGGHSVAADYGHLFARRGIKLVTLKGVSHEHGAHHYGEEGNERVVLDFRSEEEKRELDSVSQRTGPIKKITSAEEFVNDYEQMTCDDIGAQSGIWSENAYGQLGNRNNFNYDELVNAKLLGCRRNGEKVYEWQKTLLNSKIRVQSPYLKKGAEKVGVVELVCKKVGDEDSEEEEDFLQDKRTSPLAASAKFSDAQEESNIAAAAQLQGLNLDSEETLSDESNALKKSNARECYYQVKTQNKKKILFISSTFFISGKELEEYDKEESKLRLGAKSSRKGMSKKSIAQLAKSNPLTLSKDNQFFIDVLSQKEQYKAIVKTNSKFLTYKLITSQSSESDSKSEVESLEVLREPLVRFNPNTMLFGYEGGLEYALSKESDITKQELELYEGKILWMDPENISTSLQSQNRDSDIDLELLNPVLEDWLALRKADRMSREKYFVAELESKVSSDPSSTAANFHDDSISLTKKYMVVHADLAITFKQTKHYRYELSFSPTVEYLKVNHDHLGNAKVVYCRRDFSISNGLKLFKDNYYLAYVEQASAGFMPEAESSSDKLILQPYGIDSHLNSSSQPPIIISNKSDLLRLDQESPLIESRQSEVASILSQCSKFNESNTEGKLRINLFLKWTQPDFCLASEAGLGMGRWTLAMSYSLGEWGGAGRVLEL